MPPYSNDPKQRRITVRISNDDLASLQREAERRNTTVGAVIRHLIRSQPAPAPNQP
jgi:hypothetical protein